MITRRHFVFGAAATALLPAFARRAMAEDPVIIAAPTGPDEFYGSLVPDRYGAIMTEPHPVPGVPAGVVDPALFRQEVANPWPEHGPGDLVVDPDAAFLWLVGQDGTALRYGISVGAAGFGWDGAARVQFKRHWPRWNVPDEMIERRPELAPYSVSNGGMDGGPGNPLGARALYLFQNGQDTLYRIHGGCEPRYLGQAVSSGCIRMLDQDVIDLHDKVADGAMVTVLPSVKPDVLEGLY